MRPNTPDTKVSELDKVDITTPIPTKACDRFDRPAGIAQLVEQQIVMQQVPGSIPAQPRQGLTQPSIPLWVGKMGTSKNIG